MNTHRILVRGRRVENIKDMSLVVVNSEAVRISPTIVILAIAVPIIVIAMIISFLIPKKKPTDMKKVLRDMQRSVGTRGDKDEK